MPVTIVVGGQYGSEGKGKVAALTARQYHAPWVVRCGGPNSGHTASVHGIERPLRQLPAAAGQDDAFLALAAGCVINEDVLIAEIQTCQITPDRIFVDPRAVLVTSDDQISEQTLVDRVGGTGSGNGNALARRLLRTPDVVLAGESDRLNRFATVESVAPRLHTAVERGQHVILEGTQGFGLSLLHGPEYPFVTSKDTTAAAFAAEAGLSPRDVSEIVLVFRTFPIRVAGNSGELPGEVSWAEVQAISGAPVEEPEQTSVTHRIRRVGRFDLTLAKAACRYNRPTALAVMGLDRLDHRNRGVAHPSELSAPATEFLSMMMTELQVPIRWLGTGFSTDEVIDLRAVETRVESNA